MRIESFVERAGTMKIYDVRDFGALGDGKTLNTEMIPKATKAHQGLCTKLFDAKSKQSNRGKTDDPCHMLHGVSPY